MKNLDSFAKSNYAANEPQTFAEMCLEFQKCITIPLTFINENKDKKRFIELSSKFFDALKVKCSARITKQDDVFQDAVSQVLSWWE